MAMLMCSRPRFARRPFAAVLACGVSLFLAGCGGGSTSTVAPPGQPSTQGTCITTASISPPLHTQGADIIDRNNRRVKLVATNWYGAEESDFVAAGLEIADVNQIASEIKCLGFNSVRLPWSNQMYETNPVVSDAAVSANPSLKGKHALDVFDAVVSALTAQGLAIILDNHVSIAGWCCNNSDGNQLWYNATYPESRWIADWQGMAAHYKSQPLVIGADLRNEPRATATWGGDPSTDWHAAAQRGGNAVLTTNPNLLVFVEGISYAGDLTGVAQLPVVLAFSNQLVYEAHEYQWYGATMSATQLQQRLDQRWGYIRTPEQSYTAPVWLGEFGTCHTNPNCLTNTALNSQGLWFSSLIQYMKSTDIDWSYWAVNGTEARATGAGGTRILGAEETYGVLNMTWSGPSGPSPTPTLLQTLQGIMPASH